MRFIQLLEVAARPVFKAMGAPALEPKVFMLPDGSVTLLAYLNMAVTVSPVSIEQARLQGEVAMINLAKREMEACVEGIRQGIGDTRNQRLVEALKRIKHGGLDIEAAVQLAEEALR